MVMNRDELIARIAELVQAQGQSIDAVMLQRSGRQVLEDMLPGDRADFTDADAVATASKMVGLLNRLGRGRPN
jgi:hypothetical protein